MFVHVLWLNITHYTYTYYIQYDYMVMMEWVTILHVTIFTMINIDPMLHMGEGWHVLNQHMPMVGWKCPLNVRSGPTLLTLLRSTYDYQTFTWWVPHEHNLLTSVTYFSIIGNEVNQAAVIMKCSYNKEIDLINIANSTFVEIKYIKFVDCGGHTKLMAVSFENSHGHSILILA